MKKKRLPDIEPYLKLISSHPHWEEAITTLGRPMTGVTMTDLLVAEYVDHEMPQPMYPPMPVPESK